MNSAPAAAVPQEIWINGDPGREVTVLDRGLQYGDGLFETMACQSGRVRFLPLHLERLRQGCARLGLRTLEVEPLTREIEAFAACGADATLKLILTRGAALARGYAVQGHEEPTRILMRYTPPAPDAAAEAGVRVRLAQLRLGENPALAGIKHLNRLEPVLARREWSDPDIAEALLFSSSGLLISGTMSNVFLVRDGRLLTPRLDRCGVEGVMRAAVARVAALAGISLEEGALSLADLNAAQEIFLTNALIAIRPVRELAGRPLTVGPVTRRLRQALAPFLSAVQELPGA
ncbi:MAG TPA: aminodeoxychorismate lyase [Steroidobacteraceae bacterium]|nr:aminodeoxychorismate lyase [Steroidobacteraceae bacterium]